MADLIQYRRPGRLIISKKEVAIGSPFRRATLLEPLYPILQGPEPYALAHMTYAVRAIDQSSPLPEFIPDHGYTRAGTWYGVFDHVTGKQRITASTPLKIDTPAWYATPPLGTPSTSWVNTPEQILYELVAGAGSTDNGEFNIQGDDLRTNSAFDYENQQTYSIRVKTTPPPGLGIPFEKVFTIKVIDVDDMVPPPPDIQISDHTVDGGYPPREVGTLTTNVGTGPYTYKILAQSANAFKIIGDVLYSTATFPATLNTPQTVTIESKDSTGAKVQRDITIEILNHDTTPLTRLTNLYVKENQPANTVVGRFYPVVVSAIARWRPQRIGIVEKVYPSQWLQDIVPTGTLINCVLDEEDRLIIFDRNTDG